jgi:hypothetical protein
MSTWTGVPLKSLMTPPFVARLVGIYFLSAAALKLFSNESEGTPPAHYTPALQFLAIQIEIVVGAWLILGRIQIAAWLSTCMLLMTLLVLSGTSALKGQSDCGCFGKLQIHPVWTIALNSFILLLLIVFRPAFKFSENIRTLFAVGLLTVFGASLGLIANGPIGDKLMARWQGRTIVLESSVLNAGKEIPGTSKILDLTVINKGPTSVTLIGGSASCSCTTTQDLPVVLPANQQVVITMVFKFRGTNGDFQHNFDLYTDDPAQPNLHGVIVGRVVSDTP